MGKLKAPPVGGARRKGGVEGELKNSRRLSDKLSLFLPVDQLREHPDVFQPPFCFLKKVGTSQSSVWNDLTLLLCATLCGSPAGSLCFPEFFSKTSLREENRSEADSVSTFFKPL